jgi:hypothetical protein
MCNAACCVGGSLWTQVLNLVPPRSLRPHRPRQKAKAGVLTATSEQVGTAAGGSGGQASHCGAAFSPEEDLATLEGEDRASNNPLIGANKMKCPRGVPLEERPPFSSRGPLRSKYCRGNSVQRVSREPTQYDQQTVISEILFFRFHTLPAQEHPNNRVYHNKR